MSLPARALRSGARGGGVWRGAAAVLVVTLILGSCTAAPSRTPNPTFSPSPSPSADVLPEAAPIPVIWTPQVQLSFDFDPGVRSSDRTLIRRALRQAVKLFPYPHLRAPRPALIAVFVHSRNVEMSRPNEIAEVRIHSIHVFVGSDGWRDLTDVRRRQAIFHEWVHVVQQLIAPVRSAPVWLVEGTADWSAWNAIFRLGQASKAVIRGLYRQVASLINRARTLRRLEGERFYRNAPDARNYALAYLGVDFLHPRRGWRTIASFFRAIGDGSSWQEAFRRVFDFSVSRFYRSFEADRAAGFPT